MKKKSVTIDIKSIKDPSFVKTLDKEGIEALCDALRSEIVRAVSLYGGHLGSNLGAVELSVAIHRSFNAPTDKIIFDVGHETYAHKILTGRSLEKIGSESGTGRFAERDASPYDPADAGHSSTSISIAEGMAVARDLKGEKYDVVAVIGDASIANGLAFEALNDIGSRGNKIIAVLNDNDMSIGAPSGAFRGLLRKISTAKFYNRAKARYRESLDKTESGKAFFKWSKGLKDSFKWFLGFPNSFEALGFTYIGPVDGHSVKALEKAFRKAQNATKPVLVHVITKKGKGYEPAEKDTEGLYHAVGPFDSETGTLREDNETYPAYIGEKVHDILENNANAVLISAAMMRGSRLERSFTDFPNRSFDVGIAEEHAATFSSGLSLGGLHPILSLYSTFSQRAYDEILHDLSRPKGLDATILLDRAGLPGEDGETHAGVYDVAFLKTVPGIHIEMPSTPEEASYLLERSLLPNRGVTAIRYPNDHLNEGHALSDSEKKSLDNGYSLIADGRKERALLLIGPMGREYFIKHRDMWDGMAYIVTTLYPIPEGLLKELKTAKDLRVYDAYGVHGGFLEALEAALLEKGLCPSIRVAVLPNEYVGHGTKEEQRRRYNVDETGFLSLIKDI